MADRKVTISLFGDDRDLAQKVRDSKAKIDELIAKAKGIALTANDRDLQAKAADAALKLDKLGAKKVEPELGLKGYDKTSLEIDKIGVQLDKLSAKSDALDAKALAKLPGNGPGGGLAGLGGQVGALGNFGMPALIGAAVALSGQLAVVTIGLGSFGLAAYKDLDPIRKAAQMTGGLSANMSHLNGTQKQAAYMLLGLNAQYQKFTNSLKPEVISAFSSALNIGNTVLAKTQPIAAASGKALTSVLNSIDAEFRSQTWTDFFGFIEKNASPDIKQLGTLFTSLMNAVPPLVEALHPLGAVIINDLNDTVQFIGGISKLTIGLEHLTSTVDRLSGVQKSQGNTSFLGQFSGIKSLFQNFPSQINPAIGPAQKLVQWVENLGKAGGQAAKGQNLLAQGEKAAAAAAAQQQRNMQSLSTAIGTLTSKILTLQGNEVSWLQAQQSATSAIKATTGSLDSNSQSALAAKAAIIQSTQAAISYAQSQITLYHNTGRANQILQSQINYLLDHAGKSKFAAQEVYALIQAEDRIPGHITSTIKADTSAAAAELAAIENRMAQLNGQTSTVYVDYSVNGQSYVVGHHRHVSSNYATGTSGAAPGWAWVGERGPELIKLRGGEKILSNYHSMNAAKSGFNPGRGFADGTFSFMGAIPNQPHQVFRNDVNLMITSQGDELLKAIVKALRYEIRTQGGGNVQQHLGWGSV